MLKPNFDQAEFLKDYWQQKPILIKNFFSNFEDYTNPEELLEIACINARLSARLIPGHQGEYDTLMSRRA